MINMPEIFISLFQGVVQGLTEFLPVSSSGHLALLEQVFGVEPRLYLAAALHMGTLTAVWVHYRHEIHHAVIESVAFLGVVIGRREKAGEALSHRNGARLGAGIVIASLPTAAVGLCVAGFWKQFAGSLFFVSLGFLVTAAMLLLMRFVPQKNNKEVTWPAALLIGFAQGMAAFPGISRSGTTIAVALALGIERRAAARFSFLISIPAILGAVLLESRSLFTIKDSQIPPVVLGTITAGVVGYAALRLLLKWLDGGRLYLFYLYVLPLSLSGMLWSFLS